ncbi:GDT1-like protein 3 isoform X3 [Durio zibethinus]|uniref:GDT1 family protein n=1 Tax=Durio zibethinus TaxID=66656 RepID=A0A6P5WR27_DURZI|nr:GDT1-like protein 3 isoform X3 [Durio zibethinus]
MGFPSIHFIFIASFFFFALSSSTFAQESGIEVEKEESSGSSKVVGRRAMIVSKNFQNGALDEKADIVSMGINLGFDSAGLGIFDAFFTSFSMIIISEIGDETFIIAALMAMRHPKSTVLSGALTALIVMTVLSTGLGRIVPNLISRKHTNSAATVLYAFFGFRLLYIAWRSDSKASQKKEMEEVEEKLETGQGKTSFRRFFSRFCTPIFLESFILTFLAEWGDRSQIATIAVHAVIQKIGHKVNAYWGSSLIDMIAKCGNLDEAQMIFKQTSDMNVVLWTSVISSCAFMVKGAMQG